MTRAELQEKLQLINESTQPSVEVFILGPPSTNEDDEFEMEMFKARMHEDMPRQILDIFLPKIQKKLSEKEYELMDYDPSINPDRKVIWQYQAKDVPFFTFVTGKLQDARDNYYDDDLLPYENIWAIWIRLAVGRKQFYIIRKITPSKVITSGGVLAWIFRGDSFRSLEKDVLTIDGQFDAFLCADSFVFENKQNFEKALLYDVVIQQVANDALDEIENTNIVEDIEQFKDMLFGDYHSIRKLNKLRQKQYFKQKTFTDYHKIIQSYNVDIDVDEKNKKFIIRDKTQAKLLIKVLNDDFLKSELTDLKYSANSKEER